MNIIRKIIRKFGFDLHRHRPRADFWHFLRGQNIKTVLDIGANVGQFAKEAREKLPEAKIYSFEPLKECFAKLNPKTSFNFGLGEKEERIKMNKSAYSPSSSILEMAEIHKNLFPHTREHSQEEILMKRLDDVDLNLKKEILIKVDVQGFEDKVIEGGKETFKQARVVLMETSFVELYKGQPTFDAIYEKLKTLGFVYKGSLQQKVSKTGEIISEDSIFEKQALSG